MKRKRHTPEQIVKKLRAASEELGRGKELGEVCRQLEVSEATYHRWEKQYDGAQMETVKRLKELEKENSRLKKLVAEQALDMDMLKEINAKSGRPDPAKRSCESSPNNFQNERASGLPSHGSATSNPTL